MAGVEAFFKDIVELRETIKSLQEADTDRKKVVELLVRDNADLKTEVKALTDKVSGLEADAIVSRKKMSKFNKKAEMVTCLQKSLNRLHVNLQDRKDLEEEVKTLKAEVFGDGDSHRLPQAKSPPSSTASATSTSTASATPTSASATTHTTDPSTNAVRSSKLRKLRKNNKERKKIKGKSHFGVGMTKPFPLPEGARVRVDGFDQVKTACDFMDAQDGTYSTPMEGEYEFTVCVMEEGGESKWVLCKSGGGRKMLTGWKPLGVPGYRLVGVSWPCESGDKVWLEVVGDKGSVQAWSRFYGWLDK